MIFRKEMQNMAMILPHDENAKECFNCMHYNGCKEDKREFCDEKEVEVPRYGYCGHFVRK